jgi:hypothetical protein
VKKSELALNTTDTSIGCKKNTTGGILLVYGDEDQLYLLGLSRLLLEDGDCSFRNAEF